MYFNKEVTRVLMKMEANCVMQIRLFVRVITAYQGGEIRKNRNH